MSLSTSAISTKRRKVIYGLAAACLLSVVTAGVIAANGWFPRSAITSAIENVPDLAIVVAAKPETETQPRVEPTPVPERLSVELITITPRGFEPNEITRPAGPVLFVVVNRGEFPTMDLRLLAENGSVLRQAQMPRNRRKWSVPVDLPAGRYRVVDAKRPEMVLNVDITR